MKALYGAYYFLTGGLSLVFFPTFWLYTRMTGRFDRDLKERFGVLPLRRDRDTAYGTRIWVHAASLGEVKVAVSIVGALGGMIPEPRFIVSTVTDHGREMAREAFGPEIPVVFAPFDFFGSVRKALLEVRPDVMVFIETEIWPSWALEARRMGIKVALVNGRISVRSIRRYIRLKAFFREVLKNFDAFSMVSEEDADRIRLLGADHQKVEVNGNAKYDMLVDSADPKIEVEMLEILNLRTSLRVLVAGSTRQGEEAMILDAYGRILERFPDMILIIAPRHIERTPEIVSLVQGRNLTWHLKSELNKRKLKRTGQVVILDTFGELFKVYSIATMVFCGASLVPLGGQNPLEPAAWGKVTFYGPSMEDFLDAKELLERAGAGIQVSGSQMLSEKAIWFLEHPDEMRVRGTRARKAVLGNLGAAQKHAKVVKSLLTDSNRVQR